MKVFKSLEEIGQIGNTCVAVGNFDGVHKGHRELIRRAVAQAQISGLTTAVFTFRNHPRNVVAGETVVKNMLYWDQKIDIFEELGVEYLFSSDFTPEIQHMDPICFVKDILVGKLKMKEIVCGFNYHFGYRGKGDLELLQRLGEETGFSVQVMEPYKIAGQLVSSTMIREIIEEGDMERCRRFLGKNYTMGGTVIEGNKLGRSLGFPTSNIAIDEAMASPPDGVYATFCDYDGVSYPSVTNLGRKPTVGNYERSIETHIFHFDEILYGKEIRIEFLKKLRGEKKFESVEALSDQIRQDCIAAAEYHRLTR